MLGERPNLATRLMLAATEGILCDEASLRYIDLTVQCLRPEGPGTETAGLALPNSGLVLQQFAAMRAMIMVIQLSWSPIFAATYHRNNLRTC